MAFRAEDHRADEQRPQNCSTPTARHADLTSVHSQLESPHMHLSTKAKATKAKTAILCVSVMPFLKPSFFFTLGTNKAVVATSKLAVPPIKAKSEESTSKL